MNKWCSPLLGILLAVPFFVFDASALSESDITSRGAVLIDADTGQVLFDKGMDQRLYPASITKIMTGVLVGENADLRQTLTVSQTAVDIDEPDSASIDLVPGEEMTVDDAMYALMLQSANDAANALAEHVGGAQEAFVAMMNQKCAAIGAKNTHFTNPHGLHDNDHYTTPHDMALITRYALGCPEFMRYFGATAHTIAPTNKHAAPRELTTYQYMLDSESDYYYEAVFGGKIGFTDEARHTMSTVAQRGGRTLICVVMYSGDRQSKYEDTKSLLDFGFDEFVPVTIAKEEFSGFTVPIEQDGSPVGSAAFSSSRDFYALVHNSADAKKIEIVLENPTAFETRDSNITCKAAFAVETPQPNVPTLLGTQPLTAEIELAEEVFAFHQVEIQPEDPVEETAALFKANQMVAVAAGVLCLLLLWALAEARNRAVRRRTQRRLELIRSRNRKFRGSL